MARFASTCAGSTGSGELDCRGLRASQGVLAAAGTLADSFRHRYYGDRQFYPTGEILGRPRVTYESEQADDNDRLLYRIAAMEALQRCTPMPFTEAMAGAAAGRPFAVRFHTRKPSPIEKQAWLIQKTR
jgi:hypothetical protein